MKDTYKITSIDEKTDTIKVIFSIDQKEQTIFVKGLLADKNTLHAFLVNYANSYKAGLALETAQVGQEVKDLVNVEVTIEAEEVA